MASQKIQKVPGTWEMYSLVLPIQGWNHIDSPLCQQPCHTGSHINLPETAMNWRLQELHLRQIVQSHWSIWESDFRKHKFFQSLTEWVPFGKSWWTRIQPIFDVISGLSSSPSDVKCFYLFMRRLVSVWQASAESASAACNQNFLHWPMESSPSSIGGLDPVLEKLPFCGPTPKFGMQWSWI